MSLAKLWAGNSSFQKCQETGAGGKQGKTCGPSGQIAYVGWKKRTNHKAISPIDVRDPGGPFISHLNPALLGVPIASNGSREYVEIRGLWKPRDSPHQRPMSLSKGEFYKRENNRQLATFHSLTFQLH